MTCGPRIAISPTCPSGRGSPLSSKIAISVEGIGKPMVPENSCELAGLAVATGAVSERP